MITFLYTYYNQEKMLEWQLKQWQGFGEDIRKGMTIFILDDCSEKPAKKLIKEQPNYDLRVYRILDDIPWNQPGAANLGFSEAQTQWVFHGAIDHSFNEENTKKILNENWQAGSFYIFRRIEYITGKVLVSPLDVYLVQKTDFIKAGGYDEDFCGHYGYADKLPLKRRCEIAGLKATKMDQITMRVHLGARTEGLDRDRIHNAELLQKKLKGEIPFSTKQIRFKWERVL